MSENSTELRVSNLRSNGLVEWVEAGIDWLSLTYPIEFSDYWPTVNRWQDYLIEQVMPDNKAVPWKMLGYDGFRVGGCFTGTRDDGCYIQLTGAHANAGYAELFDPNAHCSRLDVQFTVKYRKEYKNVASNAYRAINRHNRTLPVTKRRTPQHIRKPDGSDTLYCGKRSSTHYGRIYNKGMESRGEHYVNAWRWEIVYKNRLATRIAGQVPINGEARARWAFDSSIAWWENYGIKPHGLRYRPVVLAPKPEVNPSDVETRLAWLERQVKPSIAWLTERGYRDRVLQALGLTSDDLRQ